MSEESGEVSLVGGQESLATCEHDSPVRVAKVCTAAAASPQLDLTAPALLMNGDLAAEMGDLHQELVNPPGKPATCDEVTMNGIINGETAEVASVTNRVGEPPVADAHTGGDDPPLKHKHTTLVQETLVKTNGNQSEVTNDVQVNGLPAPGGENKGCSEAAPDHTATAAQGELTCADSKEDLFFDAEKDKDEEFFDAVTKEDMTLLPLESDSTDGTLAERSGTSDAVMTDLPVAMEGTVAADRLSDTTLLPPDSDSRDRALADLSATSDVIMTDPPVDTERAVAEDGSADATLAEQPEVNQVSDIQVNGTCDNDQQPPASVGTDGIPPECTQATTPADLNSPPASTAEATSADAGSANGRASPQLVNTDSVTEDSHNYALEATKEKEHAPDASEETDAGHQESQGETAAISDAAPVPPAVDTPKEGQAETAAAAASPNSASIDLGKLGEISLSTQLPKMADTVGIPPLDAVPDLVPDKPSLDEIAKHEDDVFKVDNPVNIDNNERLPSIPPEVISDPVPDIANDSNLDDAFTEKAVGSGRRSSERRTISPPIGHVEIDLGAQLENIFADEPKHSNPRLGKISGTSWNKTKTPESPSYTKKENADSGVDNDDDFDTLDKEIGMLRERYQKTQDRIQKALRAGSEECDNPVKKSSANALTRSTRLGSAPTGEDERLDRGLGLAGSRLNTRKHIDNPGKDGSFGYYGTRRMITDQADVLEKLRSASQSFEEMEVEIRSLKNEFIESAIRRNQFYDDYEQELLEEEERAMYAAHNQNPYVSYYQRPMQPHAEEDDETVFKLPKTTKKPWSYTRSYTDSYRPEDGAYALPYSKVDRSRPRDRPMSLDSAGPEVSTPDLTDTPSYKPGKATSEFLRVIYAGERKKAYEMDEEDEESPSLGQYSTSPWSTTKEDYKNIAKSYKPYVKKYGADSGDSNRSYASEKGATRKYGASFGEAESGGKEAKASGKPAWDEGSYSATLPRNIGRSRKHEDVSPSDPKRDTKPKFNFPAYDFSQELSSKPGKSKYSSKWSDSSSEKGAKPKYGSGFSDKSAESGAKPMYSSGFSDKSAESGAKPMYSSGFGDKSAETGAKPKYGSGLGDKSAEMGAKPKYGLGLSDFSTERPSRASKFSSTKTEKPFTSRFLAKRRLEAREEASSATSGSKKDGGKPFVSRFLRKSTGDLTSLVSSSSVGVADSKSDPSLPSCDDVTNTVEEAKSE